MWYTYEIFFKHFTTFKKIGSLSVILLYGVGGSSCSVSYGRMKIRTVQLKMKRYYENESTTILTEVAIEGLCKSLELL